MLITSVVQGMQYFFFFPCSAVSYALVPCFQLKSHIAFAHSPSLLCQPLKLKSSSLVFCWISEVGSGNPFTEVHMLSTYLVFAYLSVPRQISSIPAASTIKLNGDIVYTHVFYNICLSFPSPQFGSGLDLITVAWCKVLVEPGFIAFLSVLQVWWKTPVFNSPLLCFKFTQNFSSHSTEWRHWPLLNLWGLYKHKLL